MILWIQMKATLSWLVLLPALLTFTHLVHTVNAVCTSECGWKATCRNDSCACPTGYTLHTNQRDCHTDSCSSKDCLECDSNKNCQRCTNFLSEQSRECLQKCNGEAKIVQTGYLQGSICTELIHNDNNLDIIIGVVAGVSVAVIVCLIMGIFFYCHLKKSRKKVNLQQQKYKAENMQLGKLTSIPTYANKGYEPDVGLLSVRLGVVNRDVYMAEYQKLHPQAPTLLLLLNQIRRKLRAMSDGDPRVPTYKGVIHQLCRVLVLLHKKEPGNSIPADALGLFEWAHQLLEDYHVEIQDQTTSIESEEAPPSKISYIDVPEEQRQSLYHQYAIPHVNRQKVANGHSHQASTLSDTGYYSSTPVPIEYHSQTLPSTGSSFKPKPRSTKLHKSRKTKSATNIHHDLQGSDLSMGYFANGRYYEPSPQLEIYAPASSYSDRSNRLSTFQAANIPRTQSFSSSLGNSDGLPETSDREDGDIDGEGDSSDNEALPFDPRDATEPMEV